jgi:DNA-binding NarL/FixJ family response regulator
MPTSIKVLIAEEHFLMAQGLQKLLETDFENIRIMKRARDLFSTVSTFKPDVVLLDSSLTNLNGIEPARNVQDLAAVCKLIILSGHAEAADVADALRFGVSGYLLKQCPVAELTEAIHQVIGGKKYVTPLISQCAIAAAVDHRPVSDAPPLTLRQREVLQLVAAGYTAKEIGVQLHLSVKTAVFHKTAIMDKLGLRTTAELTRYALENNIVRARWLQPRRIGQTEDGSTARSAGSARAQHAIAGA